MFKKQNGFSPNSNGIKVLEDELNLSSQEIYKWFFDKRKVIAKKAMIAKKTGKLPAMAPDVLDQIRCEIERTETVGTDAAGNDLSLT